MTDQTIILYGHPACPMMPAAFAMLKQAKASYTYINIYQDNTAREHVRQLNYGYESVPTLIFPDGTHLTEPSGRELRDKLQELGYQVPMTSQLIVNWRWVLMGGAILLAFLRGFEVF